MKGGYSLQFQTLTLVGKGTIPTEQLLLVGEVSANFSEQRVSWSTQQNPHGRSFPFYRPELLLFHLSTSSIVLMRLSGPHSRPTTSQEF